MMGETLVIDCNNLGYSVAHATGSLSYGEVPTGVIYGFVRQIVVLAKEFQTANFIFCWDSRKSYRKLVYPQYKENRRRELSFEEKRNLKIVHEQFDVLRKKVLPTLGFRNVFMQTGYEADDLIAHIVQRFPLHYTIVSTDNDLWQLLGEGPKNCWHVRQYSPRTKKLWTSGEFKAKWGIEPYKWIQVKAMAGCSSDGVDGVPGVGELTAIKIITGSLRKGKVFDRVMANDEILRRNTRLVTLPFPGRVPIKIGKLVFKELFVLDFMDVFTEYGFGSLLKEDTFGDIKKLFRLQSGGRWSWTNG